MILSRDLLGWNKGGKKIHNSDCNQAEVRRRRNDPAEIFSVIAKSVNILYNINYYLHSHIVSKNKTNFNFQKSVQGRIFSKIFLSGEKYEFIAVKSRLLGSKKKRFKNFVF